MTPLQINIVWEVLPSFDINELKTIMKEHGLIESTPKTEHQKNVWGGSNLNIILFKSNKLLMQGKKTEFGIKIMQDLSNIGGLTLDHKNAKKMSSLLTKIQNALICPKCNSLTYLLEGEIEGFYLKFKSKGCGHVNSLSPPLWMCNFRILPDLNILIGQLLSMCINLGYFKDFEIVIPEFVIHSIDHYVGSKHKKSAKKEIEALQEFDNKNIITLTHFNLGLKDNLNETNFNEEEDNCILKAVNYTNSILLTSDEILKDRSIMDGRPTIFLPQNIVSDLKHIEKVESGLQL